MIRFLIVLALVVTCSNFLFTKTDLTSKNPQTKPVKMEEVFDFQGAQQKAIERQRKIDEGQF